MAQALTLTVGALAWWIVSGYQDTRYTMGRGGPVLYLAAWLFVLCFAAQRERSRGQRPQQTLLGLARATLLAAALGVVLVICAGIALTMEGIGGALAVPIGAMFIVVLSVVALVVMSIARGTRAPPNAPRRSLLELATALSPLLCPVLAMYALRAFPAGADWDRWTGPEGRAGILYIASLPLWLPAAGLVAWGLDRLDGSRGGWLASSLALLTVAVLLAAVPMLPATLRSLNPGSPRLFEEASHSDLHGYPEAIRFWKPFHTGVDLRGERVDDYGLARLPLDGEFRATAAMMLAAAGASALALAGLGRGRWTCPPRLALLVLVAQLIASGIVLQLTGPEGAPWLAAMASLALTLGSLVGRRRIEAAAAGSPTLACIEPAHP